MENILWALIVVSTSANVSFTSGYTSKAMCEDAASITQTGETVAEKEARQKREQERTAEKVRKYEEAHPPRPSTEEDVKKCSIPSGWIRAPGAYCTVEKDGMTHFSLQDFYRIHTQMEIKIAYIKCVMVEK